MTFIPDKSPDSITPGKPLEPAGTTPQPSSKNFQSYMQGSENQTMGQAAAGPTGPTPMSMAPGASIPTTAPTLQSALTQAQSAQDTLGNISQQLKTPNLSFKRSQAHLLKNKLGNANQYIRQTGAKLGIEAPPLTMTPGSNAIGRFMAYVNDGQNQLVEVQQKLKAMAAKGQQLNAAEMLSVTVKMNLAQQEIEYSSTLLAKVIDSIKQVMNIQL